MKSCLGPTILTMACWLTAGCATRVPSPEAVPLDRVECARCRMLISSDSGASQIVAASEDTRFYDDIACLAADWDRRPAHAVAYVRLADGRWIDAHDASYLRMSEVRTAMASGVMAVASIADARAIDRQASVLTFDQIIHNQEGVR